MTELFLAHDVRRARLSAGGLRLRQEAESQLDPAFDVLERPLLLSAMFPSTRKIAGDASASASPEPFDLSDVGVYDILRTFDAFFGQRLDGWIEALGALHDALTLKGHTSSSTAWVSSGSREMLAWASEPVQIAGETFKDEDGSFQLPDTVSRALVVGVNDNYYLSVIQQKDSSVELHVRRLWLTLTEVLVGRMPHPLKELEGRSDLTLADVIGYASAAAEAFSDEGVRQRRIQRPSLTATLASPLIAGHSGSPAALRYGDFRDPGYVASVKGEGFRAPLAEALYGGSLRPLHEWAAALDAIQQELS